MNFQAHLQIPVKLKEAVDSGSPLHAIPLTLSLLFDLCYTKTIN